jgi:hypothetical protein
MSLYAYAMFLFYAWNSFIALLNLFVIAIITLRSEIKVTSMLIVAQCLMRDTLSYHTYRCITMPKKRWYCLKLYQKYSMFYFNPDFRI